MEQNTIKIYYIGGSQVSAFRRVSLDRYDSEKNKQYVFTDSVGAVWIEKESSQNFPAMAFTCINKDMYDGMPCWSWTITHPEKAYIERMKEFMLKTQKFSCPNAKGEETNPYFKKNTHIRPKYLMLDIDESVRQKAHDYIMVTKARQKVLDLYNGGPKDRRELYELAWEMGLNPLGKVIATSFIELTEKCDTDFNTILSSQPNELAIMDRYCRKAQYLKHNGNIILKEQGSPSTYLYCLEPHNPFATVEGFREFVMGSVERTMQFKKIVDAADEQGYKWGEGEKIDINSVTEPSESMKQSQSSKEVNEASKSLKAWGDDLISELTSTIVDTVKQGKTKKIVKDMLKHYDADKVYIELDRVMIESKMNPADYKKYFNINKAVTA